MKQLIGGPWDGGPVPNGWRQPVIAAYIADANGMETQRLAVYRRQEDGSYRFDRSVHESELEKVEQQ